METMRELNLSEMIEISGGNFAHDLGYILGLSVGRTIKAIEIALMLA